MAGSSNPKASLDAMFPEPIDCGHGVQVLPLTLAHYALLEKAGSFIILADHEPDALEVLRTMFICTHSAKTSLQSLGSLDEVALEWAENLPPDIHSSIIQAIGTQVARMTAVVPQTDDGSSKKKAMGTDS